MKALLTILFFALINFKASAVDICSFQETWDLHEALEKAGIRPIKVAKNHKRFKFIEKQMIHRMITLQEWLSGVARDEALAEFESGDGEISYYSVAGREISLVHYWPGDTQVGAIYEMRNGSYKIIAQIDDSFIECK